jgi:hypothetical protein
MVAAKAGCDNQRLAERASSHDCCRLTRSGCLLSCCRCTAWLDWATFFDCQMMSAREVQKLQRFHWTLVYIQLKTTLAKGKTTQSQKLSVAKERLL